MIDWLKKNWLKVLAGIVVLILLYAGIDGLISKITYKKRIREKDIKISELWQGINESARREESWMKASEEWHLKALKREEKLRKKDKEMRIKIAEKRKLKKKIKEMPATQVIVRTIEIIKCDEIQQQTQGIVFSLSCAKENLTILEDSFSLKREVDDWREQFFTSQGEVSDLKNVIMAKDGTITERGIQLDKKDGVIEEWKGKFTLSEKRGKRSWWKGAKTGGTMGGIAGFILGFLLGSR